MATYCRSWVSRRSNRRNRFRRRRNDRSADTDRLPDTCDSLPHTQSALCAK